MTSGAAAITPRLTEPRTRRNAGIAGASLLTVGLLMLFPTSTNRGATPRRPGVALAPPGVVAAVPTAAPTTGPAPTTVPAVPAAPGAPAAAPGAPAAAPPAAAAVVVNGTSVDTRYGPVQVQLTFQGARITTATAIDYPQSSGRDQEINSFAIPMLEQQTVALQGARVDTVSGATYTSGGYRTSLQAALNAAHAAGH